MNCASAACLDMFRNKTHSSKSMLNSSTLLCLLGKQPVHQEKDSDRSSLGSTSVQYIVALRWETIFVNMCTISQNANVLASG